MFLSTTRNQVREKPWVFFAADYEVSVGSIVVIDAPALPGWLGCPAGQPVSCATPHARSVTLNHF